MVNFSMSDALKPGVALLCKLASITVHAQEMLSPKGHDVDRRALLSALDDAEVIEWIADMTKMAMAPVRRK